MIRLPKVTQKINGHSFLLHCQLPPLITCAKLVAECVYHDLLNQSSTNGQSYDTQMRQARLGEVKKIVQSHTALSAKP